MLSTESQLRYLNRSRHFGSCAYWCAIASGQPQLGLELVERPRATIWTQALYMRTSQFSSAPPELSSELKDLLSRMNVSRVFVTPPWWTLAEQDVQYKYGARIDQLIKQIIAITGQEKFMGGLPFEELAQCANRNAVVVLVAAEGKCHVLILRPHDPFPLTAELSDIKPHELTEMSIVAHPARMRGSTHNSTQDDRMGMRAVVYETSSKLRSNPVLGKLWTTVVKPVIIDHLQLQVSATNASLSMVRA
jgi:hypothetical protein